MSSIHYCAAWTEYGCLLTCGHSHISVGEAATCIRSAGAYLVAVDTGRMRSLNDAEEAEFQAIHSFPVAIPAADTPAIATSTEIDSRYSVMTRIRVGGQWTWTTWMCFGTYAEAFAYAREGDKVVRFRSAEWRELRRQTAVAPPSHACADAHLLPKFTNETLVEFVLRMLEEYAGLGSKVERESIVSEGIQDREKQKRKRA